MLLYGAAQIEGTATLPLGYRRRCGNSSGNEDAMCVLTYQIKVMLLCVPGHSRIQGKGHTDALTRVRSKAFLSPERTTSTSPCDVRLKVKEWLKARNSAALGMGRRNSSLKGLRINCQGTYWPRTGNNVGW
jgi:hypothetical protein